MKRSLFVLITAIAAVLLFVACSPETKASAPTYDDLVGTWIYGDVDGDDYISFIFKAGNKVSLAEGKDSNSQKLSEDADVTVSGSTVTITYGEGDEWSYTVEFKDGNLVLKPVGDATWIKWHKDLKEFTFTKYYTVTFDYNMGTSASKKETVKKGEKVEEPADPTRDSYMFMGWVKADGTAYDFDAAVNGDITIKATWKEPKAKDVLDVLYVWNPTNSVGYEFYNGIDGNSNHGDITAEKIENKKDLIMESLSDAFTRENKRYGVISVDSATAGGYFEEKTETGAYEFRNVYLSFTYKKQTNTSDDQDNPNWVDDSSATYTGYVAFSYKLDEVSTTNGKKQTMSNIESSIKASSLNELPDVSSSTKISYKTVEIYLDSTGGQANGYSLGGVKLSDAEYTIIQNALASEN